MNLVILNGRLIKEPQYYNGANSGFCVLPIAVTKDISKDKKQELIDKGEYVNDIYNILVFGTYGEKLYEILDKDQHVIIEGYLSRYKSEINGQIRYNINVIGRKVTFVGNNKEVEQENKDMENQEFFEEDFKAIEASDLGIVF